MTWSSRSPSSWPISGANEPTLARTQPARSTTAGALDDARAARVPSAARQRAARSGPSPRRSAGSAAAQLGRGRARPARARSRPMAMRSTRRPVDEARGARTVSARRPSDGRRGTDRRADRGSRPARRGRRATMAAAGGRLAPTASSARATAELDALDVGERRRRTAGRRARRNAVDVAGRQLAVARPARRSCRAPVGAVPGRPAPRAR